MRYLKIAAQIALLAVFYGAGSRLAGALRLPIPGNVVGLGLLFLALWTGLLKLAWVGEGADFLIRHLVFFFIPVAVDLMNWGAVFRAHGLRLAFVIVLSTVATFLVVGWVSQALGARELPCED